MDLINALITKKPVLYDFVIIFLIFYPTPVFCTIIYSINLLKDYGLIVTDAENILILIF
jgi:hypothetical protein